MKAIFSIPRTTNIVEMADLVADAAHAAVGQVRKYTNDPYVIHPREVAALLSHYGLPQKAVAAGLLHDVLEDTKLTQEYLRSLFGEGVTALVLEVTNVSRPEDGNRGVRKTKDLEHLQKASYFGASIKYADLISNTKSIVEHDPDFAEVYLKEKEEILGLVVQGHAGLLALARNTLTDAKKRLEETKARKRCQKIAEGIALNWSGNKMHAWLDDSYFHSMQTMGGIQPQGKSYSPVLLVEIDNSDGTAIIVPMLGVDENVELAKMRVTLKWLKKGGTND